jgi:hypothetical protein
MLELPFQLKYDLHRRERIVPHLVHWLRLFPGVAILLGTSIWLMTKSFWFLPLLLLGLYSAKNCLKGIIDVLIHPVWHMDIVVDESRLGILDGGQRFYLHMSEIEDIKNTYNIAWTIAYLDGTVINIPVNCISDEQIAYLKACSARGSRNGDAASL